MTDAHLDDDLLIALALDDVDPTDKDHLVQHLSACNRCRHEYDETSSTVHDVLIASPRIQPSPGFDRRTLDAMGMVEPRSARTGIRLPRWQLAAAAVVLGALVGGGATYAINEYVDSPTPAVPAAAGATLTTSDGRAVGTVRRTQVDGQPAVVVLVTSGKPGMRYECSLRLPGGDWLNGGAWTMTSSQATWVVEAPLSATRLNLVTDSGTLWSSAEL